jgi:hypothetical protein
MKKITIILFAFLLSFSLKAQDGIEAILLSGISDANKLTEAYVNPAMIGLIHSMNGGWYHTAKAHKALGFDISISLNASVVPSSEEIFYFSELGLSANTTSTSLTGATIAGSNSLEAPIQVSTTVQGQNVTANYTMPGGVKDDLPLNAMPAPAVQFSLGLPKKIDIMVRALPNVGSDNVEGNLIGLGVKKEITNIFGPIEKLPLHIAFMGAYTTMNVTYDLQNESSIRGSNQEATFNLNAYTVQAIASINFPVINFYGGIGYSGGTSKFKMKGTYILEYDTGNPAPNNSVEMELNDPVNLNFESKGLKTTLGTRISLGFFKLFADYTIQEYNTLSAGLAFSFR